MASNIVELTKVSKRYDNLQALFEVDFSIVPGEVRALLGKNGAGKSTLIRLLSGVELADGGSIAINGRPIHKHSVHTSKELGVRTVYQELSLIPGMSVMENFFVGNWPTFFGLVDYKEMRKECATALLELGLNIAPDAIVGDLPIADQQLIEIARALNENPSVLILDEPTSSLGAAEVERVLEAVLAIKRRGVAVIYVSHRLLEIRKIADSVTVMRDGIVVESKKMESITNEEVVKAMLGDVEIRGKEVIARRDEGLIVMEVKNVIFSPKLVDINLSVFRGEVLGISGLLGAGRTELLQIMAGIANPHSGEVYLKGRSITGRGIAHTKRAGVGITPEDRKRDGIFPDLGIDENIAISDWPKLSSLGIIKLRKLMKITNEIISEMSVKTENSKTLISKLSGGNQQKIVIGRWLFAESEVLLLDEPTRGVDIEAKAQIYEILRKMARAGKSVVLVSSEIEELELVCDRVLTISEGRIGTEHFAPDFTTDDLLLSALGANQRPETK